MSLAYRTNGLLITLLSLETLTAGLAKQKALLEAYKSKTKIATPKEVKKHRKVQLKHDDIVTKLASKTEGLKALKKTTADIPQIECVYVVFNHVACQSRCLNVRRF